MDQSVKNITLAFAEEIAEKAQNPINNERRYAWETIWTDHPKRPMILTRPLIINRLTGFQPVGDDGYLRELQHQLCSKLYKFNVIKDDAVLEPEITVQAVFKDGTVDSTMFGVPYSIHRGSKSFAFDGGVIEKIEDIKKLHYPEPEVDEEATAILAEKAYEATGGRLRIVIERMRPFMFKWVNPVLFANYFVGYESLLAGMVENPDLIHAVMRFFTDAIIYNITQAEKRGYLPDASRDMWNDIPTYFADQPMHTPAKSLSQMVCITGGEEFDPVSPDMCEEFLFRYEREIYTHYRYTHYGCCESFDNKWHLLKSIPNLKMYSCSPWTDIREAVENMGTGFAIDWRVKVQDIIYKQDKRAMRDEVQNGLNIASGCPIAAVLQDVETVNGNPNLVSEWVEAARQGVEESHW